MDDSRFFDTNIEKTVGIFTALSGIDSDRPENIIRAVMPYIDPKLQTKIGLIAKALAINRLLQKYSAISVQTQQVKSSRREMLTELRQEFEPQERSVFDLFIKLTEIKELMEVVSVG